MRRVERKGECYVSAGIATEHDAKPPHNRYVRYVLPAFRGNVLLLYGLVTCDQLSSSLVSQGRERSWRLCGPQVQQQPVRVYLHLGPEH